MKHTIYAALLASVFTFALTACGEQKAKETTPPATPAPVVVVPVPVPAPTQEVTPPDVIIVPESPAAPADAPKQ